MIAAGPARAVAARSTVAVALAGLVIAIPTLASDHVIDQATTALVLMTAAMSLNLLFGYAGQLSIGHSVFFGVGAYTTGVLVSRWDWEPWATFPVALALGVVTGIAIALPALRISGIALALVTLAFAVVFPQVLRWRKLTWITGGARGLDGTGFDVRSMRHVELFGWDPFGDLRGISGKTPFLFWVAAMVAAFVALACRGVATSRPGRALTAIRDGERAATVVGIDVARTKVAVFGLSGGLCALAGSVSALRTGTVVPDAADLTVNGSLVLLVVVVLGGAGSLWGPPIGAVLYVAITETTRDWSDESQMPAILRPLLGWSRVAPGAGVFAVMLVALMFVAPDGIVGLLGRCRLRVATRRQRRDTARVRPCSSDPPRTANADPA